MIKCYSKFKRTPYIRLFYGWRESLQHSDARKQSGRGETAATVDGRQIYFCLPVYFKVLPEKGRTGQILDVEWYKGIQFITVILSITTEQTIVFLDMYIVIF